MLVAVLWKYSLDQWCGKHFQFGWANRKQETRKKSLRIYYTFNFPKSGWAIAHLTHWFPMLLQFWLWFGVGVDVMVMVISRW